MYSLLLLLSLVALSSASSNSWCDQFVNGEIRSRCLDLARSGALKVDGVAAENAVKPAKRQFDLEPEDYEFTSDLNLEPEDEFTVPDELPDCTSSADRVIYRVIVFANWTAAGHPDPDFPANPVFTPLVASSHGALYTQWANGVTASEGLVTQAETGLTNALEAEIAAAIDTGRACSLMLTNSIVSPGVRVFFISVNPLFPFISFSTRLDPSSDWFTGISTLNLVTNNQFIDTLNVDLYPWDAGSRTGATYSDPGTPLVMREPILQLSSPFAVGEPIGQVRLDCIEGCGAK